jgi:hypothetical protein
MLPAIAATALASGCLDPVTAPLPVVMLRAPSGPVEVRPGTAGTVGVQALDTDGHGVDGAQIVFLRADAQALAFEGAEAATDSVAAATSSGPIGGVEAVGVASVQVTAADGAPAGDTSVLAVVATPTPDPTKALSLRIAVRVLAAEPADGGGEQEGGGGGDGGTPDGESTNDAGAAPAPDGGVGQ